MTVDFPAVHCLNSSCTHIPCTVHAIPALRDALPRGILVQLVAVHVNHRQSLPQSCLCTYDIKPAFKLPLECQQLLISRHCNSYIGLNLFVYHLASLPSTVTFSPCLESVRQGIELVPRQAGLFLRDETSQTASAAV